MSATRGYLVISERISLSLCGGDVWVNKGHVVDRAVLCTPAKFNSVHVEGTRAAAKLAGLEHVEFISEPMAASFGYGFTTERAGKWLVYDLGGGTFDAVVVQNQRGRLNTLDIEGINQLGGGDMDRLLWDNLVFPQLARELGRPVDDPAFSGMHRAGIFYCEKLKIALSTSEQVTFNSLDLNKRVLINGEEAEASFILTRGQLNQLIDPLVARSLEICRTLKQRHPDLSAVLVIGGPTHMPCVREAVASLGLEVQKNVDPMTAVVSGAALYASTVPVRVLSISPLATNVVGSSNDAGPVRLQLDYEPKCEDTEAPIVICGEDPRAATFEIVCEPNWRSGGFALDGLPKPVMVRVAPRKTNVYLLKVYSHDQCELPCEPAEFSIFNGITTGPPPLPESFRVEFRNADDDQKYSHDILIAKGTPLPARGTVTLRTSSEISRQSATTVTIKIWEGDYDHLRANRLAFVLTIDGSQLRTRLPAKSEIEITLRVSTGRDPKAEAHVDLLDQSFPIPAMGVKIDVTNPDQLAERRDWLIGQIDAFDEALPEEPTRARLELLRQQLFGADFNTALKLVRAQEAETGDAASRIDTTLRETEGSLIALREHEEKNTLPAEWAREKSRVGELVESPFAVEHDQRLFGALTERGDSAQASGKINRLRTCKRDVVRLKYRILGRDPGFWRGFYKNMNKSPAAYTDSAAAIREDTICHTDEFSQQCFRAIVRLAPIIAAMRRSSISIFPDSSSGESGAGAPVSLNRWFVPRARLKRVATAFSRHDFS